MPVRLRNNDCSGRPSSVSPLIFCTFCSCAHDELPQKKSYSEIEARPTGMKCIISSLLYDPGISIENGTPSNHGHLCVLSISVLILSCPLRRTSLSLSSRPFRDRHRIRGWASRIRATSAYKPVFASRSQITLRPLDKNVVHRAVVASEFFQVAALRRNEVTISPAYRGPRCQ